MNDEEYFQRKRDELLYLINSDSVKNTPLHDYYSEMLNELAHQEIKCDIAKNLD